MNVLRIRSARRRRAKSVVLRESERILNFALRERVPAIYQSSGWVHGGGLMSYGPNNTDEMRRVTACVASDSLSPKRVELLREILPGVKRIGLLGDPSDPTNQLDRQALAPLVASMGLHFAFAETVDRADFDAAVARLLAERVEAIFPLGTGALFFNMRPRLIELANQKRLPVVGHRAQMADSGALFAFGASLADQLRRSALLVDKILKGAKPPDLPVEQPSLFELVINLKAAKALGVTIPRPILLRADRVIE